jgi:hypothetical protein
MNTVYICIAVVALLAMVIAFKLTVKDDYVVNDPEDSKPHRIRRDQRRNLIHVYGMGSGYLV